MARKVATGWFEAVKQYPGSLKHQQIAKRMETARRSQFATHIAHVEIVT